MSYSIKKAGIPFKLKLGTNADLTGEAENFSAYYIKDADGVKTDVVEDFVEDANTAGLYMVEVTIPAAGDYTMVINNDSIGMGNHESPLVVVDATIDDVKLVVDALTTTLTTVAADVDGLNGTDLQGIRDEISAVKALLDDEDTTTVNSVMEFVKQIDDALSGSGSGLAALSGYTDDIENMLLGTEFLADGTTANPFYDAANPGIAKESSLTAGFAALGTAITDSQTVVTDAITAAKDAVQLDVAAVQTVVDANKANLENAGYGLIALKDLIDTLSTDVGISETNILDVLGDASNGLAAINTNLTTRFDAVDAKLLTIEGKVEAGINSTEFKVFA